MRHGVHWGAGLQRFAERSREVREEQHCELFVRPRRPPPRALGPKVSHATWRAARCGCGRRRPAPVIVVVVSRGVAEGEQPVDDDWRVIHLRAARRTLGAVRCMQ